MSASVRAEGIGVRARTEGMYTDRLTDRQADKAGGRQAGGWAVNQTDKTGEEAGRQTGGRASRQVGSQSGRHAERWLAGGEYTVRRRLDRQLVVKYLGMDTVIGAYKNITIKTVHKTKMNGKKQNNKTCT